MNEGLRVIVEEYARQAYTDLAGSGLPEFGKETQVAIVDTAGMYLHDAGYEVDDEMRRTLREIADELA